MTNEKPIYLIAGKGSSMREAAGFFRLAFKENGLEHPRVAYIGTASDDSKPFFRMFEKPILDGGASKVTLLPLAGKHPDAESAKQEIDRSEVVFINGGEVYDGMEGLVRAGLVEFLKEKFYEGKLFIGLSAGAIMLGRHWVLMPGDQDRTTPLDFDCLGFAPCNFDTHAEDEDWIELRTLLALLGPKAVGRALPTGCFIRIDAAGKCTDLVPKCPSFVIQ